MSYPLTQRGAAELIAYLYSLPDSDLQAEAAAIKSDFKTWITKHFTLTSDQKSYLASMANSATQYFGEQCSFCFIHRLNVSLDYPAPPAPTGYGKWTESTSSTKLITNSTGNEEASGELKFTMVYRPL